MLLCVAQFTRAGHTQLRGNAILITSTITVVLFSTVVCNMYSRIMMFGKIGCIMHALILTVDAGLWVDHQTTGEVLDAFLKRTEQIDLFRARNA